MVNSQLHELAVLYIKEKNLVSGMETPEQLIEMYDDTIKKFSKKYLELNPSSSKNSPRKRRTVSLGVDDYNV